MEKKYLEKIEFNKILEILESLAITTVGKTLCQNLQPSNNRETVIHSISETTECTILKIRKGTPPIAEIDNILPFTKALKSKNSLSASALLGLGHLLKISRELKEYITSDIEVDFAPIVSRYFFNLYSNPKTEKAVLNSIIDENTIDDNASPQLANIRRNKRKLEQDIRKNLSNLLNSKYIQEPIVTIKNGQLEFSIPIRTFLSNEPFIMNLNSNIEVANNKIMLKDTTFSTNSNIINIDILGGIINQVNPVAFQINSIDSKYCKIYITSAKIEGNIIKTEGIFIINKNYER